MTLESLKLRRETKKVIMATWFQVELNALISRNLFCWKLSTHDLKFPGGGWHLPTSLQPTLSFRLVLWLCGCSKVSAVNSVIKHRLPSVPFPFLDIDGEKKKVRSLGTKDTNTCLNQWSLKPNADCSEGCSLDSTCGAGLATSGSLPESFCSAFVL